MSICILKNNNNLRIKFFLIIKKNIIYLSNHLSFIFISFVVYMMNVDVLLHRFAFECAQAQDNEEDVLKLFDDINLLVFNKKENTTEIAERAKMIFIQSLTNMIKTKRHFNLSAKLSKLYLSTFLDYSSYANIAYILNILNICIELNFNLGANDPNGNMKEQINKIIDHFLSKRPVIRKEMVMMNNHFDVYFNFINCLFANNFKGINNKEDKIYLLSKIVNFLLSSNEINTILSIDFHKLVSFLPDELLFNNNIFAFITILPNCTFTNIIKLNLFNADKQNKIQIFHFKTNNSINYLSIQNIIEQLLTTPKILNYEIYEKLIYTPLRNVTMYLSANYSQFNDINHNLNIKLSAGKNKFRINGHEREIELKEDYIDYRECDRCILHLLKIIIIFLFKDECPSGLNKQFINEDQCSKIRYHFISCFLLKNYISVVDSDFNHFINFQSSKNDRLKDSLEYYLYIRDPQNNKHDGWDWDWKTSQSFLRTLNHFKSNYNSIIENNILYKDISTLIYNYVFTMI